MRGQNEAIRSYVSCSDAPESVTILDGEELRAFGEKAAAESGKPLGKGATVVKFDRCDRIVTPFISVVTLLAVGMIIWDLLHNEAYPDNPHWAIVPGILLVVVAGIGMYAILHAGFSDRWLLLDEAGARFRVRRFIRYRVETFPFASIKEIAVEIIPTRRGELARLAISRGAHQAELFRAHVEDAENGVIAWAAGLLGAATGLPVTRRKFPGIRELFRRRR